MSTAIIIEGGSSLSAEQLAAQYLFSDDGVIYVSFDETIGATSSKRSWWDYVLAYTDTLIEPEFAVVPLGHAKTQVIIQEAPRTDPNTPRTTLDGESSGIYRSSWLTYDDGTLERGDPQDYTIEIAADAHHESSSFAGSSEAGWTGVAFHELGHALGLEHPHESGDGDVDAAIDTNGTVMSYVDAIDSDGNPAFTPLDIQALQQLHGHETGARSTPVAGVSLLSDSGNHDLNRTWKTPSLSVQFEGGSTIQEPTSGTSTARLVFTRYDGDLSEAASVLIDFDRHEDLNWYGKDGDHQDFFHDVLLDNAVFETGLRAEFAAGQRTVSIEIDIVANADAEADEWLDITARASRDPDYFQQAPSEPLRLTVTETAVSRSSLVIDAPRTTLSEGDKAFLITVSDKADAGKTLYWSASGDGLTSRDLVSGQLQGSGTIDDDGVFVWSQLISRDGVAEKQETMNLAFFRDAARTTQLGSTTALQITASEAVPTLISSRFTRTGGQDILVGSHSGLPVQLANPGSIRNLSVTVRHDPAALLLDTSHPVSLDPTLEEAGWNITASHGDTSTHQLTVNLSGTSDLPVDPVTNQATLLQLKASVNSDASTGSTSMLSVSGQVDADNTLNGSSSTQLVGLLGDSDGDGKHSVSDAISTLRHIVGLEHDLAAFPGVEPRLVMDVNEDGSIGVSDAIEILRKIVGLSDDQRLQSPTLA
jgi:hypothetical protein